VFVKDTLPVDLPEVAGVHFDLLRNKGVTGPIAQRWRREQSHRFADSADDFILWPQFIDVYTDDEDKGDAAMVGAVDELCGRCGTRVGRRWRSATPRTSCSGPVG